MKWYEELASSNPGIVKFVASIGKSVEGRDLPAVHIGTGAKQIYFQCQIHASKRVQIMLISSVCLSIHDLTN